MGLHTGVVEERDGNYFGPGGFNQALPLLSAAKIAPGLDVARHQRGEIAP
jgi:hypothetical protein